MLRLSNDKESTWWSGSKSSKGPNSSTARRTLIRDSLAPPRLTKIVLLWAGERVTENLATAMLTLWVVGGVVVAEGEYQASTVSLPLWKRTCCAELEDCLVG